MNKRKPQTCKYLTPEQYDEFMGVIEDAEHYLLFHLTGKYGLRIGEAVRLRIENFNFKQSYVQVPCLKRDRKKGIVHGCIKQGELPKVYEDLPLLKETQEMLIRYLKLLEMDKKTASKEMTFKSGWLFFDKGSHLPTFKAQRLFKKYAEMIGLDSAYSVHSLRHYKGMEIYRKTKDIKAVKTILRHTNLASSDVYTTMNLDDKRKIMEG